MQVAMNSYMRNAHVRGKVKASANNGKVVDSRGNADVIDGLVAGDRCNGERGR